jgi:hypothetical protein
MTGKSRRTPALLRRCVEPLRQEREQQEREQQERKQQEREQQDETGCRPVKSGVEPWHASASVAWVLVRVLWLSAVLNPG